jgi:HK97 gp10 family phage protein
MSRYREYLGQQGYRRTGAKQSKGVELEGFEDWIFKVKSMSDKMKVKVMKDIIKKNMEPIKFAIKANTPIRKSSHFQGTIKRKRKGGAISSESEVGNLYKSIGIRTFSRGTEVTAYAGIQKGRGEKFDGWYGFFIERGTKHMAKNPFIARSAAISIPLAEKNLEEDVKGYIVSNAKKLGLDAK